jgi:hypothetical protein
LLCVRRTRPEQRPVPLLALAHCLDLGLISRHLGVQVLHRDSNNGKPVTGGVVFDLHPFIGLPLRQMGGPVRDPRELGIQLRQLQ